MAAWIEFDSPDLLPLDAANVLLSISEYNMYVRAQLLVFLFIVSGIFRYEITNLGAKTRQPVEYRLNGTGSLATYRLEIPHPDGSGARRTHQSSRQHGVRYAPP